MFGKVTSWAEDHPYASIAIGLAFVLFILWLFGAFRGSSDSGGEASAGNMAAAYYAAEAQQAVVGGQIQIATIQANRDTAINADQTAAAVKLGKQQVKLGGIQAKAATDINQQNANVAITNINANERMNQVNAATYQSIAETNARSSLLSDFFHSILPTEIANGINVTSIPGLGTLSWGTMADPNTLRAAGYSEAQIRARLG